MSRRTDLLNIRPYLLIKRKKRGWDFVEKKDDFSKK